MRGGEKQKRISLGFVTHHAVKLLEFLAITLDDVATTLVVTGEQATSLYPSIHTSSIARIKNERHNAPIP